MSSTLHPPKLRGKHEGKVEYNGHDVSNNSSTDASVSSAISPSHYALFGGDKQVIDLIKDQLTHAEFMGYLKGNMLKYHMRHGKKNGLEDLRKMRCYLEWYIKESI